MSADDFASAMRRLAPAPQDLLALGLTPAGSERKHKMFEIKRRSSHIYIDPLMDLCTNFDLSTFEVGYVRLRKPSDFDERHWNIGTLESDPIIYSKVGGPVVVRDHEVLSRVVCTCAHNADAFLDALHLVAIELKRQYFSSGESNGKRFEALSKCVSVAGSDTRPFYQMLLDAY
jgi:hypothetical protein